jgi:TnpA family transposase
MSKSFLSPAQSARYGRYAGEPSQAQLERFFHLDDYDRSCIRRHCRGDENRLGFAAQVATVRFLGTFLTDPCEVPKATLRYLAEQLEIYGRPKLTSYRRGVTHWRHAEIIRKEYGYFDFASMPVKFHFLRWMYSQFWVCEERLSVVFDRSTNWLVGRKVLLPGSTTLSALVSKVRERASVHLIKKIGRLLTDDQGNRLEQLLLLPPASKVSELERLRDSPRWSSARTLAFALRRLESVQAMKVGGVSLQFVPPGRLQAMARYVNTVPVAEMRRLSRIRLRAYLLVFIQALELQAADDALDILDAHLAKLFKKVDSRKKRERLGSFSDLSRAAGRVLLACRALLDDEVSDPEVRQVAFQKVPVAELRAAIGLLSELTDNEGRRSGPDIRLISGSCRNFLLPLLRILNFESNVQGQAALDALHYLRSRASKRHQDWSDAPVRNMAPKWQRIWKEAGEDERRDVFTAHALEALHENLRRRDVFVVRSQRHGDPRQRLLAGEEWQQVKPHIQRVLGWEASSDKCIARLLDDLDNAYTDAMRVMAADPKVRIQPKGERQAFVVSRFDALPDPQSLVQLRERVHKLLPRVQLPEALMEIHERTGFLDRFVHLNQGKARAQNLPVSICAALISQACNVDLESLVRSDVPALSRDRLSWVAQNYIRKDTLLRANADLVDYHSRVPLVRCWGGGEVASADGLRFVVPVRTINAGFNPVYFGVGRGLTYYNYTSDQFSGFHGIVIPGTLKDSAYLLEGILEHQTSLRPREIMTDTGGASEAVFGLFCLLGFQFSPRLADSGACKFYRAKNGSNYGPIELIRPGNLKVEHIEKNWDDLLRVVGSLKLNRVSASELLHSLLGARIPTALAKALCEVGKVAKTIHLLRYVSDENYRRRILVQLNRGEQRHSLARRVFHGRRGELRQPYREGQEDQLSALGLVVNALVLWNTLYMNEAVNYLRNQQFPVDDADLAHLSPLEVRSVNLAGTYNFNNVHTALNGQFRPLNYSSLQDDRT